MAQEEVDLRGSLEQAGVLRVEEPAQARACVEQQEARARRARRSRWSLARPRGIQPSVPSSVTSMCPHLRLRRPANECVLFGPTVQCRKTALALGAPWRPGSRGGSHTATSRRPISRSARRPGTSGNPRSRHLAQALAGDETAFLDALESAGSRRRPHPEGAHHRPARRVQPWERGGPRAGCSSGGDDGAEAAARRLAALEHVGAHAHRRRVLGRPRGDHRPAAAHGGGVVAARRGQRRDQAAASSASASRWRSSAASAWTCRSGCSSWPSTATRRSGARPDRPARADLHQIGDCLRENLRRYDSVGLTDDGAFVLVLPDISRRGLAGAAERLRREIGVVRRPRRAPGADVRARALRLRGRERAGDARRARPQHASRARGDISRSRGRRAVSR